MILTHHERRSTSGRVSLPPKQCSMRWVVTALKIGVLLNIGICYSGTGCQEGAQPSRELTHQMATKQSPAMVTYLKEQDTYKSFLVGGHLASRSSVQSRTGRASDSTSEDRLNTSSE